MPDVRKAVRWNTPFYGVEGRGWFLSYHCLTKSVKVGFHNGGDLEPKPPVESRCEHVRFLHLVEDEAVDEAQLEDWVRQAAALPGEEIF